MKTSAFLLSLVLLAACSGKTPTNDAPIDQPVTDNASVETTPEQVREEEPQVADEKAVESTAAEPKKEPLTVKPERKIKSLKVELIGPKWKMTELVSKKVQKKAEPYFIHFEKENQFTAYAGCNHYNGSFKVKGSKISFSDVMGTKMACEDMKEETYLNEVLRSVHSYKIIDGELQLIEKSKVVARFN